MSVYQVLRNLDYLASQMLEVKEKVLTENPIMDDFDFITTEVHGAAGLHPSEMFTVENLRLFKKQYQRSYLHQLMGLALMCGAQLEIARQEKKQAETVRELEHYKKSEEVYHRELARLQKNQMPEGNLEGEILDLRGKIDQLNSELSKLRQINHWAVEFGERVARYQRTN